MKAQSKEYFKPCLRFKRREHPYDIGMPFSWWPGHYDRHFLNNLYERDTSEFDEFYHYHLAHFLKVNSGDEEPEFFRHVWDIVHDGIAKLIDDDDVSSKAKHHRTNKHKLHLRAFVSYLDSIDGFNARPSHIIIAEKDTMIARQQQQIADYQQQLEELNKLEVKQKIMIEEDHLPTLIHLLQQLIDQTLPSGRFFLKCDNTSPYYKMVSKYFSKGGSSISKETVKNYFGDKKKNIQPKTPIPKDKKLFKIVPVDPEP
ncbi:MAG: hypothetical protein ABIN91_04240 [Mucilaginibacter sp.]|uniref:hypothetical protein n=1 Tax=Mucilaginibacter sp. TaxID=1882438 RepID=UPI0032667F37